MKETFLALEQTKIALTDCATFLLDRLRFNYVLLGGLQSDPIESRFGWLRQLAGANYCVSMLQVSKGDRKIQVMSLLRLLASHSMKSIKSFSQKHCQYNLLMARLLNILSMPLTINTGHQRAMPVYFFTSAVPLPDRQ